MKLRLPLVLSLLLVLQCLGSVFGAYAQDYPTKTAQILVGFPPGGSVDSVARIVADGLTKELGQKFIVENKTGATGTIAANTVATSKPDGYTLLLVPGGHALYRATISQLPFDPAKSFDWISNIMTIPFFLVVPGKSEIKSLSDLIAKAKASPEKYKFGSVGPGSPHHLGIELLSLKTGAKFLHVPFRGEGPVVAALMGSEIDFSLSTPLQVLGNMESGAIRALAVTSKERSSRVSDAPTVGQELALGDFDVASWFALAGPAGMPKAVVDKINAAVTKVLATEGARSRLVPLGGEIAPSSPSQMRDRVLREQEMWSELVEKAGVPKQ